MKWYRKQKNNLDRQEQKQINRKTLWYLLLLIPLMFAFGYALVPLYRAICSITGVNTLAQADLTEEVHIDQQRTVTIEFDAHSPEGFRFVPLQRSITAHPGQAIEVFYEAQNQNNQTVLAQAIPSYAPKQGSRYISKLECFCFQQQSFLPHENKKMPVRFVINPALPKDMKTITLSYTLFRMDHNPALTKGKPPVSKNHHE